MIAKKAASVGVTAGILLAQPAFAAQASGGAVQSGATSRPVSSPASLPIPASIAATPAFRDQDSGVEVYTTLDAEMFPATWREPAIGAAARPLTASDAARAVRLIRVALSKYPPKLLQQNIERVYLVGALQFQGISASGTNSSNRLYIVVDGSDTLYTDSFVEESFHHEFAHMLRRNYPEYLTDADWCRNNPPDFQYGAPSGVEAVKAGRASLYASDDWNRRGFLSEYGAEDAAEDFATIAGSLFAGDSPFWQRTDRFVALKNKITTAIGFFTHLAPSFNEPYFRSLHAGLAYVPRSLVIPGSANSSASQTAGVASAPLPGGEHARGQTLIDRVAPTRRPAGIRPVMRQSWRDLLFLHWSVAPSEIQALLPAGLTVDTFNGEAWVGLVPFTMRGVRPVWAPSVPGLSNFHEINVRTYVNHETGGPGVWFFSLDASNAIAVAIARILWQLPYFNARITLQRDISGEIDYRSQRQAGWGGTTAGHSAMRYRPDGPTAPAEPETLEYFLVERYLLYSYGRGSLWRGQVHHTPYPLQPAQCDSLSDTLVAAAGITLPDTQPLMHFASGVDVDIFPLRKLPSAG